MSVFGIDNSDYTCPVLLIPFIGVGGDRKIVTIHVNETTEDEIRAIAKRQEEDGYKPLFKDVRREYKVRGSLVQPDERRWLPNLGFRRRSAHIRA